jgi:hypothetical protein
VTQPHPGPGRHGGPGVVVYLALWDLLPQRAFCFRGGWLSRLKHTISGPVGIQPLIADGLRRRRDVIATGRDTDRWWQTSSSPKLPRAGFHDPRVITGLSTVRAQGVAMAGRAMLSTMCPLRSLVSLNKGGRDDPSNMQWWSREEHQDKSRRPCRP